MRPIKPVSMSVHAIGGGEAYASPGSGSAMGAASFLREPPADTQVLFGYVRDAAHHPWILKMGLYNVSGGIRRGAVAGETPDLQATLLLLWSGVTPFERTAEWFAVDRAWMERSGYPRPR